MANSWIIVDNHLAIETDGYIIHPSAKDVYALLAEDMKLSAKQNEQFVDLRFSKIGAPISVVLTNSPNGGIQINLFASYRHNLIPIDIVNGNIIDHCVFNNIWFYVSGNVEETRSLLEETGISSNGEISINQYLKLIEKNLLSDVNLINNKVSITELARPIDNDEDTPKSLNAKLFPYQQTGYLWIKYMLEETKGCILGDEMGLGKTIQVITEMLSLKDRGISNFLVIAPISLLANWKRECEKFAPSLKTFIHHGSYRSGNYKDLLNYDVIITSYATAVSDVYMLKMTTWELVVLDEAQNIKNPYSARTKACKQLLRNRSLAVSGTPFENHVSDIWSLIDFVQPGLLGSLSQYKEIISDDIVGGEKIEPILTPLMVRRLVKDVAKDLPEKVVSVIPLQMSEEECLQYIEYRDSIVSEHNVENITLESLQLLRIYCTHPFAALKQPYLDNPDLVSVKYQRFCEILEEIISRNEKVIVFTSYKMMFEVFCNDIPMRFKIPINTINGETPIEDRQTIVDQFNNTKGAAMLALNPRAAGTGLNITGANHVVHFNLEWNPSLEDQSTARAYRRGQQKTVFVYRLYYEGTIEEVVNERIDRKREIAATAIVGTDGNNQDRKDIIKALSLVPSFRK